MGSARHRHDGQRSAPIERASAADLGQLAVDAGSVPNQVGAVLVLDAEGTFDTAGARELVAARFADVPRLRQRLVVLPVGYGAPVWVDDHAFDIADHVTVVSCPWPGDEQSLLDVAADATTRPLPRTRPLWSITFVVGLAEGRVGMVVVFHHVLADGLGGLAVLARLLDGTPGTLPPVPRPPPTARALRSDAAARRWAALRRLPGALAQLGPALQELGGAPTVAARCSLNAPTGPHRRVAVVRADLARMKQLAHLHGGTVNDLLLSAICAALATVLRQRGEHLDQLVVSTPVAAPSSNSTAAGNRVGIASLAVPVHGTLDDRLREIAAVTRRRKQQRGSSAALMGYGLRLLARLRLLRWFIDRQRMVHTFVTNLRGPSEPIAFAGCPITGLIPLSLATGNVTVAFAALSYSGTVTVTIVVDPDHHADLGALAQALSDELTRDGRHLEPA